MKAKNTKGPGKDTKIDWNHRLQRYTRFVTFGGKSLQIPYIVTGSGGRTSQSIKAADGTRVGDESFESSLFGHGFLTLKATKNDVTAGKVVE
jgi:hypothetical protein